MGGAAFAVSVGVAWLDLSSFEQYVWFSFVGAVAATVAVYLIGGVGRSCATPVRLTLAGVALGASSKASTPLRPVEPLGPRHPLHFPPPVGWVLTLPGQLRQLD